MNNGSMVINVTYSFLKNKEKKKEQRELQSDHVFSSKQNFQLSSFNCNDVCGEQIIKDVSNNLELDQLNLLDQSIEQMLVNKKNSRTKF